jgi:hypothetical protein
MDIHKITDYTVFPIYNQLSDHDAELLIVKNVNVQLFKHHIYTTRNIHKYSTEDFKIRLKYESWDSIFGNNDNMDVDLLVLRPNGPPSSGSVTSVVADM